jgi:hypothetical protein
MRIFNYEGDKPIKLSLKYIDNLIQYIGRLISEEDKKAFMDGAVYII